MSVRSGQTYWQAIGGGVEDYSPLQGNISCDVVIVGGGITGALTAYRLARSGLSVVLVDRRSPGTGSTAASTGLLQYEVDTPLCDLIEKVGEAHALHAYRRGLTAIDELEELVSELGDECGFSRTPSLYLASNRRHLRRLKKEFECRRAHGFFVEYLDREAIAQRSSLDCHGAIWSIGDAQIDPYRLTQLLLRRGRENGLAIHAPTLIESVDEQSRTVRANCEGGSIFADRIVFATGYESQEFLGRKVGTLNTTYAAASEPLASFTGWPEACLIWETARPYFYARQTPDGRAMIGGEDSAFASDHRRKKLLDRRIARLKAGFERLFPALCFTPAYAWAGTFGETNDGLACIGQQPGRDRAYFALGYGGNGITYGMIAARLICDLIRGKTNNDAEVFRFDR